MVKSKGLKSNFFWNLTSNVVYGLYQWLLVAVIAKLAGPSSVGEYSLAAAVIVPVQMFFNMQLRAIQASDAADEFRLQDYVRWRYLTTVSAALVIGIISISGVLPLQVSIALGGMIAVKGAESIADVLYGAFQRAERMDISSRARIYESVLAAIAFTAIFWSTHNLLLALLVMSASLVVVLLFFTVPRLKVIDVRVHELFPGRIRRHTAENLLKLSIPLGVTMAIISANAALPRLALGRFESEFEVGIYAGLAQLIVAGTMVVGAAGQAVTPRLARHAVVRDYRKFNLLLRQLVLAAFSLGVVGVLLSAILGGTVLKLLYTEEYGAYTQELTVLALSAAFTFAASFQGYALTALRVISQQVAMVLVVTGVTLIGLIVTVPVWGLMGACLSVLLGSLTQFLFSQHMVRAVAKE